MSSRIKPNQSFPGTDCFLVAPLQSCRHKSKKQNHRHIVQASCYRRSYVQRTLADIPEAFDWRNRRFDVDALYIEHLLNGKLMECVSSAVTPVNNQGSVGTCWAFSTVCGIEWQRFTRDNDAIGVGGDNRIAVVSQGQHTHGALCGDACRL